MTLPVRRIANQDFWHRYRKWDSEKVLSFVPPDGQFKLMSYRYIYCRAAKRRFDIDYVLKMQSFLVAISSHATTNQTTNHAHQERRSI